MSYRIGNRNQQTFFPPSVEDYVSAEDPVRVYDAFIDALNLKDLGITINHEKKGCQQYHPKQMLKLIVYGYSYNIRTSRTLERACCHNISFIWLMGNLKPDYRTIARFRSDNTDAIKKVLKQCVHMCMKMNLIEGNILFTDGSKFRANASIKNIWSKERIDKYIKKLEERIDTLLEENSKLEELEKDNPSLVKIQESISDQQQLKGKMQAIAKELESSEKKSINAADKDSVKGKSRQGTHAIHNVQSTVDHKHGLIVSSECVSQSNDYNQLSRQLKQSSEILGKSPKSICADAGYAAIEDLQQIPEDVDIIVPSKKQAQESKGQKEIKPFDRSNFIYHSKEDEYECPAGQRLTYRGNNSGKYNKTYRTQGSVCRTCKNFGECTESKKVGRKIIRLNNEEYKEKLEANYLQAENQKIYALRKQTVEHPFGHLKKNLGAGQFLMRGKAKVDAEISVLSTCFNVRRMMTIVGIPQLIAKIQAI